MFLSTDSEQWQCRYRLKDIGWVRRTTRTRNLEVAIERACDWYDEARYRLRAGLAPEIKRIGDIARETVQEMHTEMAAGRGKRIYTDYCSVTLGDARASSSAYKYPDMPVQCIDLKPHRLSQGRRTRVTPRT